nr:MAG TPA: Morphogenesis protein 1 wall, phi29, hydrolase, infection [Caudoviricetes sp.]
MAKKNKNYVKDKQPKTLWNKIGPFVKLREYLASNITPDVYANERGLKTKIMEFFGQDVPKANVDDFSQNLWFRFLNQPNNLKEENGIVRIPDNIKSIISDRINGGWEKMAKKYGKELDSLDNKIIDGKVAGKDVSDLEELRDVTSRKLGMVEEGIDLLKKARTGEHQVFNEYNFIPDAYGDLNDLSGLSSFTMYRDDKGRMVVKDKYDFYRNDQPIKVGIVTKTLDAIGYPFEIRDYVEDKIPYEESDPNKILFRSIIDSKNDLDKRMEIRSKKQGGESSKPEIDWDLFKSKYENMKRVGKGKHRTMDVEGMNMIYDALYDKGFNQRQIEAVLGNIIEESGGNPYAVSEDGKFRGLFQEYYKRYPPKEFERDKERFKSDKRGYINYMIDRFYDHVQDAGKYSIKDTKYKKAIHAVNEFMSEDPDTDYSYPLVYAFEAPSDKEGTYKNRKSVSNLISQSYVSNNVDKLDDDDKKDDNIINAILGIKNDLELQDPISTTRGEAFKEARKRGLKEFTWNGKRYNTNIKKEGGVIGKQREAYEYFTGKRGMSKIQALAIIGNLMAESGLKDDIYGDNRTSYGIQQWHNERMDKLFKHAKKKGHSTPTFKDQLEFLADEYEGKTGYSNFLYTRKGKEGPGYYNYSRQDFMNADNLKDAVVAWNQGAGRPHKSVIRNDDRYNYAMEVAKNLGLDIEENSISSYGQMGFGDDGEIAASVTLPEVEVAAALPNPEAPSQERQSEEERFRTWTETYGKDIVAHLLSLKEDKDDDKELRYQQHMKKNEEDKRRAFIQSVLPSIQLRIKGVTEV